MANEKRRIADNGTAVKKRKRKKKKLRFNDLQKKVILGFVLFVIGSSVLTGLLLIRDKRGIRDKEMIAEKGYKKTSADLSIDSNLVIFQNFLQPNPYSRPGNPLKIVNNIVVHYVANPGTSAESNRNYFDGLALSHETSASSHFIVGLDGEVVQCIPLNEISYCSNNRNNDTISIEVCHPDETGKFTEKTYDSLVKLCAWLCKAYELDEEDLIRHYDITGKICPKYFVDYPEEWEKFKRNVGGRLA